MQLRLMLQKLRQALKGLEKEDIDFALEVRTWMEDVLFIAKNEKNTTMITIDFNDLNKEFASKLASALLDECELSSHQRLKLSRFAADDSKFLTFDDKYFTTAKELFNHMKGLRGSRTAANIAIKLGNRCYPAHADVNFHTDEGYSFFQMHVHFNVGQYPYVQTFSLGAHYFSVPVAEMSEEEKDHPTNLKEWLEARKIVALTPEILDEITGRLERVEKLKPCTQMICTGAAVDYSRSFFGASLVDVKFGSMMHPEKVIFDSEFEQDNDSYRGGRGVQYPYTSLVRVFSLRMKNYFWVDVGDLDDYYYDKTAVDRLVLPDKTRNVLVSIFNRKDEMLGDVIAGKHGGMVIMACGPTGVGKTLTAEVLSEYTERPLYVMELGELGTNLASVEETLHNIFKRVTRWNALLLFDEADVFLYKRDDNLERSAIVGIFLRLLDYFPGVMFLTTNRSDVIDPAILSRVTIKLDYPALDDSSRDKIWKVMFKLVGQTIETSGELSKVPINGRQIRNLMRLSVAMHGKAITPNDVIQLSEFTAR